MGPCGGLKLGLGCLSKIVQGVVEELSVTVLEGEGARLGQL